MNTVWLVVLVFICVGIGLWLASFIVEALRRAPEAPKRLSWAPDIEINYLTVNGNRLRYIRTGLFVVLLHTLNSQFTIAAVHESPCGTKRTLLRRDLDVPLFSLLA